MPNSVPPKPLIAVVEDEQSHALYLSTYLKSLKYQPVMFELGEHFLQSAIENYDLVLLELLLPDRPGIDVLKEVSSKHPGLPVIVVSDQSDPKVAAETIKEGAYDYVKKPIDNELFAQLIRNALRLHHLEHQVEDLILYGSTSVGQKRILTKNKCMLEMLQLASRARESDITVLISGESGTGKELLAEALHHSGRRRNRPFIAVNCAALPDGLIESELFGHEKGAFTGAIGLKPGRFELAAGGTLLLDEIGELPLDLQPKLLRVLQNKEFQRVGGSSMLKSDVRVIAATNQNLQRAVENRAFRSDLYFRLAQFPITIPPLRARKDDILYLTEEFLHGAAIRNKSGPFKLSREVADILEQYHWPGNVRELEHAIERAVLICTGSTIQPKDLPDALLAASQNGADKRTVDETQSRKITPLLDLEIAAIRNALIITQGDVSEAAQRLRINKSTLYRMMKRFKITR